jgi:adenylyl-sulfate kinase
MQTRIRADSDPADKNPRKETINNMAAQNLNQKGFTLWFTGLSGAGKTALAKELEPVLQERGLNVERLDGDIVRQSLTKDLGFSKEDRDTNIERVTFVAKLLTRNNVAVLCSFISPYTARRDKSRAMIGEFVECYIECPLEVLIERDVKGLYKKALAGEIKNFTGISDPYEAPSNPEIVVNSATQTIKESLSIILERLEDLGYIPPASEPVDGDGAYSDEEEQEVQDRLRALGYI